MKVIETETIGQAWREAVKLILDKGDEITDDEKQLLEIINLSIIVNDLGDKDGIGKDLDDDLKEWMEDNFNTIKRVPELNNSWSYAWRLYDFQGVDQIQWVIDKLKKKPESKSATITMLQKAGIESYVPCVSLLDFKLRNQKLILNVTCRSLDFGKKALHNFTNLADIANKVAKKLNICKSKLILHVNSAHIYSDNVEELKKHG